ncbi:glycerophosphoryl diester phosphodiesterase [Marinimicrobium koreense]|uniref:Glycerophosphoryl diester phosphodiesterase n=1 Tax=Marinimicrobium koreense TaxID=306545 RepID=A0A3N1P093_9GAMM|nr:glycerophosphodiester phosphodiesterase [Marinimicrobium koreense]ROQ21001.1 glycerophosphoryl diester phosphodiesterase [Marinimicrobium koreense]
MLCIAHRGGPGPENSLEAIRRSLAMGAPAIEIDVWQLHDELWVTHDRRLGREIAGYQVLSDLSRDHLEALRLSNGEHLPRLSQVLELVGERALLNIELKGPDCVDALVRILTAHRQSSGQSPKSWIVSSFDHCQLAQLQQRLPEVRRGLLLYGVPLDLAQSADRIDAYSVHLSQDFMPEVLIEDIRQRGRKVWIYTANHPKDWRRLMDAGVDGIFTDHPDGLMRYLAEN